MPKAGRYDYPDRDLDACIDYLRKAYEKTRATSVKRDTFAEALDLSPKTGPFGVLVGSLGKYGLADTHDGYITYTDLAQKILFEPTESSQAKSQAVRKVTLFATLILGLERRLQMSRFAIYFENKEVSFSPKRRKKLWRLAKSSKRLHFTFRPLLPWANNNRLRMGVKTKECMKTQGPKIQPSSQM